MDYSLYPRHDVLCIDQRSFYASVEAVKLGLDPMKVMLAVVGDISRKGSIVLAASPALKEKYGIINVSRFYDLPNDPKIIVVQAQMADYINTSAEISKLLLNYAPKEALHVYSIDEQWLCVDGLRSLFDDPWDIAERIKQDIFNTFGLTCSIGIGDNKFLAKVIMDLHAKEVGIAECRYEDVQEKLWYFPVEKIWGIGGRTKYHLNNLGIVRLGQFAKTDIKKLKRHFGILGEQMYYHAWGSDLSPVFGDFLTVDQKGFSQGITLLRDYTLKETITAILDLCEEVCKKARSSDNVCKTINLSVGYSKMVGLRGFSRSKSLDYPSNTTVDIFNVCLELLNRFYDGESAIRHIQVSINNLQLKSSLQLNLFDDVQKENDLEAAMDFIRDKFGPTSILRASSYTKAGVTIGKSKKIGGHYS